MTKRFTVKGHLEDLAKQLLEKAAKKKEWSTHSEESMAEYLMEVRKALLSGHFWARVDQVSRSGRARTLVIATGKNVDPIWDDAVLDIMGISPSGSISGCGMDMCFHAQYTLFRVLCPDKTYLVTD